MYCLSYFTHAGPHAFSLSSVIKTGYIDKVLFHVKFTSNRVVFNKYMSNRGKGVHPCIYKINEVKKLLKNFDHNILYHGIPDNENK